MRRPGEAVRAVCALALLSVLPACGSADAPRAAVAPDAGDAGGAGDAGVGDCPDPHALGVHYLSKDITQCPAPQNFSCTTDQNGFYSACGCGCIDKGTSTCTVEPDPRLHFVSHDPNACAAQPPKCTVLQQPFDNSCGCGCIDP